MVIKIVSVAILLHFCMFTESCSGKNNRQSKDNSKMQNDTSLVRLNIHDSIYSQVLSPLKESIKKTKFVKIQVVKVTNPELYPVSIEAYYVQQGDEDFLGTFALYPPDNTGDFLIATQGKLKSEGEIILKLKIPQAAKETDTIDIKLKKISFQ